MSTATVARSATGSLTELFGVVTTTAAALTTAVDTIGQAAKVGNMHATRWANRTRKQLAIEAQDEDVLLVNDAAFKTASRLMETKEALKRNPDLADSYKELVDKYTKALAEAQS